MRCRGIAGVAGRRGPDEELRLEVLRPILDESLSIDPEQDEGVVLISGHAARNHERQASEARELEQAVSRQHVQHPVEVVVMPLRDERRVRPSQPAPVWQRARRGEDLRELLRVPPRLGEHGPLRG
jgi:hypothetical protein